MRILIALIAVVLVGCLSALVVAKTGAQPEPAPAPLADGQKQEVTRTIHQSLKADGRYKILLGAIADTDFEKALDAEGTMTFFAPMDEAFERVPKLSALLNDRPRLLEVLDRHVLDNRALDTADLRTERVLIPKAGKELKVKPGGEYIEINDAKILSADNRASNGIVHGIDHVLMVNNDSMLREAAEAIERGLKKGAEKVEHTFDGKDRPQE
ncbi:MAG: fasciclin domain-containing protein [Planctomycetota bacterium]|nr:fasciclin domain-containing protein [Planctomycetota bacterium]